MPEITEATLADVPQLAGLLAILFTHEVELAPDPVKQENALRLILGQPEQGRIYCAREGERVLGMVSILFTISTAEGGRSAWLEDMVVHPEHRNRGLGENLIQHALHGAQRLGCTRITLLADGINEGAMRFYERAGFLRSAMVPFRLHCPKKEGTDWDQPQ
jgi:ribosomal protein S18 acetylase RimI-like enzyme